MRDPSLAPVVLALRAAPTEREVHGLGPALAAYRTQVAHRQTTSRRRTMFATAFGAKLGATLGGVAAGLAGVTTVVLVSTNLPSGAPAGPPPSVMARPAATTPTPGATTARGAAAAQGPDADGPARHGLCTAWKARAKHGDDAGAERSVAYRNLVKAAGGVDKLAAFCADVAVPGASGRKDATQSRAEKGDEKDTEKGDEKDTETGPEKNTESGPEKDTEKPSDDASDEQSDEQNERSTDEPSEEPTETGDSSPTPGTAPSTGTSPHAETGTPVPPRATPTPSSPTTIP